MPRGRPRKTDPDAVLETAMKVFWQQGFEGTSMNDLVSATGMAKPGLYATFGDKETVYTKALEHYFHEFATPLLEDFAASPEPLNVVVRRFLQAIAASASDRSSPSGCFLVNSVVECASQPPALEELGRSFNENRRAAFVKRFRASQKNGELPADADARALAEFFAAQSLALAVLGRSGADRKTLERFIRVAMTALPVH